MFFHIIKSRTTIGNIMYFVISNKVYMIINLYSELDFKSNDNI